MFDIMSIIALKPRKKVVLKLDGVQQMKWPKLCLSLDETISTDGDDDGDHRDNKLTTQSTVKKPAEVCDKCVVLKRMVCFKDIAIERLTDDRDQLKVKLTKHHNKNIELKLRLKGLESQQKQEVEKEEEQQQQQQERRFNCDNCMKTELKYKDLIATNEELMAINRHLRQHLDHLRHVFNEFHNNSGESTGNTTALNVTSSTSTTDSTTQSMSKTLTQSKSTSTDPIVIQTNSNTNAVSSIVDDSVELSSIDKSFEIWYNK
ncbi:probable inactive serine/threonine-protein kinase bub1 [Oppia nitens]|uniref:probable inactive serine/threonine-protein kinase bub1 n=1 Tax=Oppia nitens TaxID=1686743 RepID=UPI0023DAE344|nr:probable inactive serine/threonine-protein kinase bub1 [Oppia nitens]